MNRYNRAIISEFTSNENKEYLRDELNNYFDDPKVFAYLRIGFDGLIDNFASKIERDFMLSDPVGKINIYEQIKFLNSSFLRDRKEFINTEIFQHNTVCDKDVSKYMINDGVATTRNGSSHYKKSADNILSSWRNQRQRGVHVRDDEQGDSGMGMDNSYYGERDPNQALQTGIVFCDQTNLNTSHHMDQLLNNSYMKSLNDEKLYGGAFGYSTPESDSRLLERRIFRNGHGTKTENGINSYEARLQRRNIERDVSETFSSYEKDCMIQKHDMTSLFERVDQKNNRKMSRHLAREQMQYS